MKRIQKFPETFERLEMNIEKEIRTLRQALVENFKTYEEIQEYIEWEKKNARWDNDLLKFKVLSKLEDGFNAEKNNLSPQ